MAKQSYLVVTAGGMGTRMGADRPKQFLSLDGVPVLRLTIERFCQAVPDLHIVTVLPKDWLGWWRTYCLEKNFPQIPRKEVDEAAAGAGWGDRGGA